MYDFKEFLKKNCVHHICKYGELKEDALYLHESDLEDLCFWQTKKEMFEALDITENDTFKGFELINPYAFRIIADCMVYYFDNKEDLDAYEQEHINEFKECEDYLKEWGNISFFGYKEFGGFCCENYAQLA